LPRKSAYAVAFVTSLGVFGGVGVAQASASPLSSSAVPAVAAATRTYTVQPGDTLSALATRFDTTVGAFAATNHIVDIDVIDVGQTLTIPSRTAASASAAPSRVTVATSSNDRYSPSGIWSCIADHESGGNPGTNTGNGYYGMYQFTLGSWAAAGGYGNPAAASAAEQTAVAQHLEAMSGWGNWPVTSRECGA
jgi:LysM repeat protein